MHVCEDTLALIEDKVTLRRIMNEKPLPTTAEQLKSIEEISEKITETTDSSRIFLEELIDIAEEISKLEFQFPRVKLKKMSEILML